MEGSSSGGSPAKTDSVANLARRTARLGTNEEEALVGKGSEEKMFRVRPPAVGR